MDLGHALHGGEVVGRRGAEPGEDVVGGGVDGYHERDLVVFLGNGGLVDTDAVGPDEMETALIGRTVRIAEDVVEGGPQVLPDLDEVAV